MATKNKRPRPTQQASVHEKARIKKIVVLLVLLSLLWLLFAPGLGVVSYMKKKNELQRAEDEAAQLQKANAELQEEIDKLLTDPLYLEKLAREKYELLKPDEKVYDFSKHQKKSQNKK